MKGWGYTVIRSAKSHGPADFLAGKMVTNFNDGTTEWRRLAVQAKGGGAQFTPKDASQLVKLALAFDAVPVLYGRGGSWWQVVEYPGGAADRAAGEKMVEGHQAYGVRPLADAWF